MHAARETVEERVLAIVAAHRKIPREQVALDTSFAELGIDSLDGMTLLGALEEEFQVLIPNAEAARIVDVRSAVAGILSLLAAPPAAEEPPASTPA